MKKITLALAASLALLFAASSASAAPAKTGNLEAARAMRGMAKLAAANPTPPPAVKKAHRILRRATRARLAPRFRMRHVAR